MHIIKLSGVTSYTILLVQFITVCLHGINEECQNIFFPYMYRFEVLHKSICQLRFIQSRSRGDFVVPFVPPQGVNLQLVQIHLRNISVSFVAIVLGILASSLGPRTLNDHLVEIADVNMPCRVVDAQVEPPLRDRLLYSLAVRGVACRLTASLAVVHQAADLVRGTA